MRKLVLIALTALLVIVGFSLVAAQVDDCPRTSRDLSGINKPTNVRYNTNHVNTSKATVRWNQSSQTWIEGYHVYNGLRKDCSGGYKVVEGRTKVVTRISSCGTWNQSSSVGLGPYKIWFKVRAYNDQFVTRPHGVINRETRSYWSDWSYIQCPDRRPPTPTPPPLAN